MAARSFRQVMSGSSTIDPWMVDQIIPYVALAAQMTKQGSKIRVPELSNHARANMWVVSSFLPVGFRTEDDILECYSRI